MLKRIFVTIKNILKNWTLIVSMAVGIFGYLILRNVQVLAPVRHNVGIIAEIAQPILIIIMLFLAFCKTDPRQLKPHRWMFEMVAIQTIPFMLIGFILYLLGEFNGKVVVESLMLCLICPTATAASVVVNKLDGNPNTVVSYTLVIYLITAILIPATLSICDNTYMHTTVADAFWIIIKRIFPMLTFPMIASWIVRLKMPKLHKKMVKYSNRAFYLWAICLALSIGISVNSLYKTNESISNILLIAAVSLASCIMQFYVGRKIGNKHHDSVAATQSLGQKNSALIIWIGYTFLNPVTSIAGGFYAIWQNLINTWQLYEKRKKDSKANSNQQR